MKYVPYAWTMTVLGVVITVRGIVLWTLWLNIIGDALIIFGVVWFFYAWDKYRAVLRKQERTERKVDRLTDAQADANLIARAADRKADEARTEARKAHGQTVKGKCVFLHRYPQKEETA